jgi:peptidoglycan/LPS O-acetylase OafA/YrhL
MKNSPVIASESVAAHRGAGAQGPVALQKNEYRADIDGIRAIAVGGVVVFHAFPSLLPGGFVGVDVFFVISGYLISSIIFNSLTHNSLSFAEFYARRIKRLFPALIVVFAASIVFGWFFLLPHELYHLSRQIVGGASFLANFLFYFDSGYFDTDAVTKPMLHLWSLAIEEQFYIVWPAIVALLWIRRRLLVPSILTILGISFGLSLYLSWQSSDAAFYLPIARAWELLLGSVLAYLTLQGRSVQISPDIQSLLGLALLASAFLLIDKTSTFPGLWALLPTFGAFFLISAGKGAWFNRHILSNRLLVSLGLISYPLYLWHWPLLSFAIIVEGGYPSRLARVLLLVAAVVLSYLTYRYIERRGTSINLISLMAAFLLMGSALMMFSSSIERPIYGVVRTPPPVTSPSLSREVFERASCSSADLPEGLRSLCLFSVNKGSDVQIIVWGDSHAASWAPAFAQLALDTGYGVTVLSNPGCAPIIGVWQPMHSGKNQQCDEVGYSDSILMQIAELRPRMVVLAARWDLYYRGFTRNGQIEKTTHFLSSSSEETAPTSEVAERAFYDQLPATIAAVRAFGATPLVVNNPPVLGGNINNFRMEVKVTRSKHIQYQDLTRRTLDKADAHQFDPTNVLCSEFCMIYTPAGHPIYTDDNHLSSEGALYLYPHVKAAVQSVLAAASGD